MEYRGGDEHYTPDIYPLHTNFISFWWCQTYFQFLFLKRYPSDNLRWLKSKIYSKDWKFWQTIFIMKRFQCQYDGSSIILCYAWLAHYFWQFIYLQRHFIHLRELFDLILLPSICDAYAIFHIGCQNKTKEKHTHREAERDTRDNAFGNTIPLHKSQTSFVFCFNINDTMHGLFGRDQSHCRIHTIDHTNWCDVWLTLH